MKLKDKIKIYPRRILHDERGYFLKVITGKEDGLTIGEPFEVYITHGTNGAVKGGHYHVIANEWFTCICGEVKLQMKDIVSEDEYDIVLSGEHPITVYVPHHVAHTFIPFGKLDFTILAVSDRLYDPADTIVYG